MVLNEPLYIRKIIFIRYELINKFIKDETE